MVIHFQDFSTVYVAGLSGTVYVSGLRPETPLVQFMSAQLTPQAISERSQPSVTCCPHERESTDGDMGLGSGRVRQRGQGREGGGERAGERRRGGGWRGKRVSIRDKMWGRSERVSMWGSVQERLVLELAERLLLEFAEGLVFELGMQ
jgi:hypothetical protein